MASSTGLPISPTTDAVHDGGGGDASRSEMKMNVCEKCKELEERLHKQEESHRTQRAKFKILYDMQEEKARQAELKLIETETALNEALTAQAAAENLPPQPTSSTLAQCQENLANASKRLQELEAKYSETTQAVTEQSKAFGQVRVVLDSTLAENEKLHKTVGFRADEIDELKGNFEKTAIEMSSEDIQLPSNYEDLVYETLKLRERLIKEKMNSTHQIEDLKSQLQMEKMLNVATQNELDGLRLMTEESDVQRSVSPPIQPLGPPVQQPAPAKSRTSPFSNFMSGRKKSEATNDLTNSGESSSSGQGMSASKSLFDMSTPCPDSAEDLSNELKRVQAENADLKKQALRAKISHEASEKVQIDLEQELALLKIEHDKLKSSSVASSSPAGQNCSVDLLLS